MEKLRRLKGLKRVFVELVEVPQVVIPRVARLFRLVPAGPLPRSEESREEAARGSLKGHLAKVEPL